MSLQLRHEAFCLDAFQKFYMWMDDFLGDQLQDEWTVTLTSGGTGAVIDGQTGGIYRLGTPTASDSAKLTWGAFRTLIITKNVTFETRMLAPAATVTDTRREWGLLYDATNYYKFLHDYDSTDIHIATNDGAGPHDHDSAINLDASYHIYRIRSSALVANHVHFYIDGTETAESPISDNITAQYVAPYLYIISNADSAPATQMDIDYVACRQDR